jgi:hypothetical protein
MQPVDLPERCEVEFDTRAVSRESPDGNLDAANNLRGRCYSTHEQGMTARRNELEIENNPGDELQSSCLFPLRIRTLESSGFPVPASITVVCSSTLPATEWPRRTGWGLRHACVR